MRNNTCKTHSWPKRAVAGFHAFHAVRLTKDAVLRVSERDVYTSLPGDAEKSKSISRRVGTSVLWYTHSYWMPGWMSREDKMKALAGYIEAPP